MRARLSPALLAYAAGLLLFGAPTAHAAPCPDDRVVPDAHNLQRVAGALLCLHNRERRAAGVPRLRRHRLLEETAQAHAADLVARRYFAYDTPEGLNPFQRLEAGGYIRPRVVWNAGENIGWATGPLSTARGLFDAWLKSRGHRLTLLASDFSELGVGISLGAPDSKYAARSDAVTYVVDFGWRERLKRRHPKN